MDKSVSIDTTANYIYDSGTPKVFVETAIYSTNPEVVIGFKTNIGTISARFSEQDAQAVGMAILSVAASVSQEHTARVLRDAERAAERVKVEAVEAAKTGAAIDSLGDLS